MRLRASLPDFLERLLVSLWAGGLWTIGFVAAPTLFRLTDDRVLAGRFAGALFHALGWIGLACGSLLLVLIFTRSSRHRHWAKACLIVAMLCISAWGQFILYPEMNLIRDTPGVLASTPGHARFVFLHGFASTLFVINSILAAGLIWLQTPRRD